MLKNERSANRYEHQNRKTEVFWPKKRKTDRKNSQNRKTDAPSLHNLRRIKKYLSRDSLITLVHAS